MNRAEHREHSMDALRVLAIALVLVWHAAFPYMRMPLPNLEWAVYDAQGSLIFDVVIWWCMTLAMPLFFFLAGFNAAKLHELEGPRGFIDNRVRTIVMPFFTVGLIVLAATYLVWGWGWTVSGRTNMGEVMRGAFSDPQIRRNIWGPGHLWFLEYLVLMYAAFMLIRRMRLALPGASLFSPLAPFLWALPTAALLYAQPRSFYDFHNTFLPEPMRLAYNAVYFFAGAALYPERARLDSLKSRALPYLALSVFTFAMLLRYLPKQLVMPLERAMLAGLAVSIALTAWSLILGMTALMQGLCGRERRWLRYLSDASYWVYFVHFPVVGLFQIWLYPTALPPALKAAAALLGATAFGLLSYDAMRTFGWAGAVTRQGRYTRTESAGGIVLNAKGEVLVVSQHGSSWSLPKGHIDPGEDAEAAARREIAEESGVTQLTLVRSLGSYSRFRIGKHGGEDRSELKRIHFFQFTTQQTQLAPTDPHNPEARWVPLDEAAALLTHPRDKRFFSSIIKAIRT